MQLPNFKNKKLLEQAFIHRSYLNESKQKVSSNERLEFLGDSILSFIVSDYLYRKYPEFNEGLLTNLRSLLVNTKSLGAIGKELGFGNLLRLSKGEEESEGRENQSLLADCFEAFIGALFLDQGISQVTNFLSDVLLNQSDIHVKKNSLKDPKSMLQEKVQSEKLGTPIYKVLLEEGPAHAKIFTVGVFVNGKLTGKGTGKSKQEAEENAAKVTLDKNLGQ